MAIRLPILRTGDHMNQIAVTILSIGVCAFAATAADSPQERLKDASAVFSEIMATPDKGIPEDLLEKAHCIIIVPDLKKGAFIVGAKYGKGVMSWRMRSA